ncbi:GntR family transcriptional regulator [Tessaracoccus sp.]
MSNNTAGDGAVRSLNMDSATAAPASGPFTALSKPVARHRISDAVFEVLSESIRSLRLPPGEPISEPGIAASLEVSRSPVREAFTRLVDHGLITVVPQVGSYVARISVREVEAAVFIRQSLETSAFQRAIQSGTPDTTEVQGFVNANRVAMENRDMEAFFNTDEQIHQSLFVLAGLPKIWGLVFGTKMQIDRLRRINLAESMILPELIDEHQQIVDALRERDQRAGVEVIADHSQRVLRSIDKYLVAHPSYFAP